MIVFGKKGLAWEGRYVDILKGEQLAPEYLKLNPKAVVPTLVHDGKVIRESTLICEYLDEIFPEMPLRPKDPYARVEMRMWTKRLDEEQHPTPAPSPTRFRTATRCYGTGQKRLRNISSPCRRSAPSAAGAC